MVDAAEPVGTADPTQLALTRAFRAGYRRLVSALTRRFGAAHLDLIENAVQEAMVRALERWAASAVPADAEAWLLRVAHNAVVDALRREARVAPLAGTCGHEGADPEPSPESALDDELRLIFLCCHPALSRASQVALTLKVAGGFTAQQVAAAFLTNDATVTQRIVRAKQRLRHASARFDLPDSAELGTRLEAVLDVLYLMFNEGHSPTNGEAAIKDDLCAEALRLSRVLTGLPLTATPAAEALCALFCFQLSRAAARTADDGSLLLLSEQDRALWDATLIRDGFASLQRAARGGELTRFHLEAGIAACHAAAPTYAATDWPRIVSLYDALRERAPSPVVEVNRAVAVAMVDGAPAGIDELDSIPERELVESYPYALAAYAELHASLGHLDEACAYLTRALERQSSRAQRALLERKRAALSRE